MKTGKDFGLPSEYADWVEKTVFNSHSFEPSVRVMVERLDGTYPDGRGVWVPLDVHTFVAPEPKSALDGLPQGTVVSFTSRFGSVRCAIRGHHGWRVFENGVPIVYCGTNFADPIATDAELLGDVNDDGFAVFLT